MSTKKNTKASKANTANNATGKGEGKVAESAVTPTATPAPAVEEPEEISPEIPAEEEATEVPIVDPETPVIDPEESDEQKAPEVDSALTGDPEKDRLIVAETEGEQPDENADFVDVPAEVCPELHAKLCDSYPHIDHFFLTTDFQVFLPANKQYALDHEKSLKTGDKIGRLSR